MIFSAGVHIIHASYPHHSGRIICPTLWLMTWFNLYIYTWKNTLWIIIMVPRCGRGPASLLAVLSFKYYKWWEARWAPNRLVVGPPSPLMKGTGCPSKTRNSSRWLMIAPCSSGFISLAKAKRESNWNKWLLVLNVLFAAMASALFQMVY